MKRDDLLANLEAFIRKDIRPKPTMTPEEITITAFRIARLKAALAWLESGDLDFLCHWICPR